MGNPLYGHVNCPFVPRSASITTSALSRDTRAWRAGRGRRTVMENYRLERNRRRSFDTTVEYGTGGNACSVEKG
jgi:hypothetical protein